MSARNVFGSKTAAITAIFQKLDKSICATCDKRVFYECKTVPQSTST
jgi:SulP family sulfate permease